MTKDISRWKNCSYCGSIFYRDKRNTWKYWGEAKFCSRTCSGKAGALDSHKFWGTVEERFWKRVDKSGDDDCWRWSGAKRTAGYGLISFSGKLTGAAKVSLIIHGTPVPDGMNVLHKCDNPNCVNPKHLYVGTLRENSRDAVVRGRFKRKLTKDQAIEIRGSSMSAKDAAEKYNVTDTMIYRIRNGKAWSSV